MKIIEVDDDLYQFIAGQTQEIGESASDILRRLLLTTAPVVPLVQQKTELKPKAAKPKTRKRAKKQPKPETTLTPTQIKAIVQEFLDHRALSQQKGVIGRFLYILAELHQRSPAQFNKVLEIQGRDRLYFATSKEELLAAGSSTNPKQIPGTNYWVISNTNTTKKRAILEDVCRAFRLKDTLIECLPLAL